MGGEGVDAGFGDCGVRLEGGADVVECGGDVEDAAGGAVGWLGGVGGYGGGGLSGEGAGGVVFGDGGEEVGEGDFCGVVGAQKVDVHDGFHGVGGELGEGGEEIACCAGAVGMID